MDQSKFGIAATACTSGEIKMKYKTFFYLALAFFIGVSALSIILPHLAQAQKSASPLPVQTEGDIDAAVVTGELWKLGFTVENNPLSYTSLIGRVAGEVATFRSNRSTTDIYYIFPAPATSKTIQSAKFYILDRTGTYPANATLTLQTFNFAGALQRTVSAASVDLQTSATGTWNSLPLSGTAANLQISPGEFLAFHFNLSGAPSNDLNVRPIFEIEVQ